MNDRQEKIHQILTRSGSASIAQLKQQVYASEATIRRDLTHMEQEGLLIRTWGGAVSRQNVNTDPPLFIRENANPRAKNTIARLAAGFIRDNMTVFLAAGTTVTRLAKCLTSCSNLTVITNGMENARLLGANPSTKVILPGGELHENYDLIGPIAENTIDLFHADLLVFSCSGITHQGFTSVDLQRLDMIRKMQRNSQKTILLADTSKVGKTYTYRGFAFEQIDHVIMEAMPGDILLRNALGKKLITP